MHFFAKSICWDIGGFKFRSSIDYHLHHIEPSLLLQIKVHRLDFFFLIFLEFYEDHTDEEIQENVGADQNEDVEEVGVGGVVVADWTCILT